MVITEKLHLVVLNESNNKEHHYKNIRESIDILNIVKKIFKFNLSLNKY